MTTASYSVGIGYQALDLDNGGDNVGIGYSAGSTITSGQYNTVIGAYNSTTGITTGNYNTVIGWGNSATGITTGSANTIIGGYLHASELGNVSNNVVLLDGLDNIRFWADSSNNVTNMGGTKNKGTLTLVAGTKTTTVASGATCVCSDTTALNAVQCSVSSTTLTANGTGTDVIAYMCF
jgi:hypothetical protein